MHNHCKNTLQIKGSRKFMKVSEISLSGLFVGVGTIVSVVAFGLFRMFDIFDLIISHFFLFEM